MKSNLKKTHIESSTVVQINASHWPLFCGFFCQRRTETDVIDPANTSKKEANEHPAIEPPAPHLCHK